MCVQCVLQCSRAYTFKQLCEKSENILRQYISPEFQVNFRQKVHVSIILSFSLQMTLSQSITELKPKIETADEVGFADTIIISDTLPEFEEVSYTEDATISIEVI